MNKRLGKFLEKWNRPFRASRMFRLLKSDDRLLASVLNGLSDELMDQLAARADLSSVAARAYAIALQKKGREPEAQHFLSEARILHPDDDGLRFQADALARHRYEPLSRAYSLLSLLDIDGSRAAFADALVVVGRRLPAEALTSVLCGSGWVEISAGLPKAALEFFKRAILIDPSYMDAHHGVGCSLRIMGDRAAARPHFARAANLNKSAPAPLAMIGWCHYEDGCFRAARLAFEAAVARNSLDLEGAWGWAWSLWRANSDDAVRAFCAACAVGWHTSGPDLLVLAKKEEQFESLLPLIVRAASVSAPHVADEAVCEWLSRKPKDPPACAKLLRRAGLHRQLIGWVENAWLSNGPLVAEALQSAIILEDKEAVARLLTSTRDDCPAFVVGQGYQAIEKLEEAMQAFQRAVNDGDLFAPAAVEDLERRLRFSALGQVDSPQAQPAGGPAESVRQVLLARRELAADKTKDALRRLQKIPGQRALELVEMHSASQEFRTGAGALAANLRGEVVVLAEIPQGPYREVLKILQIGGKKGRLSRRQVRLVLKHLHRDPEDLLLAAAARQAFGFLEKTQS